MRKSPQNRVPAAGQYTPAVAFFLGFFDDLKNLRANAVLIVGVLCFGGLVAFYSDKMFGDRQRTARAREARNVKTRLQNDVVEIEQAMAQVLASHKGVSRAAEAAKKAVASQHALSKEYTAAAIFVFQKPGLNLHLAMRNAAKHDFVKEVVLWHASQEDQRWPDRPKDIYGKPVKYARVTEPRKEMHKYIACATMPSPSINTCYYQDFTRDTKDYLKSLWANFLRAPLLLHTAVGATTYYNDLELRFRETAFGIDAGFAYVKNGAFFQRRYAQKFVNRIKELEETDLDWDEMAEKMDEVAKSYESAADVYFTLWLNRPPAELSNDIVPYKRQIDEPRVYERNAFARRHLQNGAHITALKQLLGDALTDKFEHRNQTALPDGVSSCSKDKCVLITNMESLKRRVPMIKDDGLGGKAFQGKAFPGKRHLDGNLLALKLRSLLMRDTSTQECDVFKAHQPYFAVDGDSDSQWVTTTTNVSVGHYYGLDMLKLHKDIQNVTVTTAHPFQQKMVLEVSMDGLQWFPIIIQAPMGKVLSEWRGFPVVKYVYDLSDSLAAAWQRVLEMPKKHHATTPTPPLYIRYLRFRAIESYKLPLIVFDISFGIGEPFDGIKPDKTRTVPKRPMTLSRKKQREEEDQDDSDDEDDKGSDWSIPGGN